MISNVFLGKPYLSHHFLIVLSETPKIFAKSFCLTSFFAKALFNLVQEKCIEKGTKVMTLNSSPYAHNVYIKFGFKDRDGIQEVDGIKFYQMYKEV